MDGAEDGGPPGRGTDAAPGEARRAAVRRAADELAAATADCRRALAGAGFAAQAYGGPPPPGAWPAEIMGGDKGPWR
jgi:hypothetical protein